jgi:integrase
VPNTVEQPLDTAIAEYLDWAVVHAFKPGSGSPRTYRIKLDMYARHFGHTRPVREISGQDWMKACGMYWAQAAPETYNSGRRAAISFLKFCRDSEPPLTRAEPPKLWTPRPVPKARDKALPQATMTGLLDPARYPLRERTLWSVLYDSSERLSAVLSLDVPQIDLERNFAKTRIKGGDTRYIAWTPYTGGLLRELIGPRTWGPVWLGEIPPWNWRERPSADKGPPAHNPAAGPLDPEHGHLYRLTAHRARVVYTELTGLKKPHRIRHTRLKALGSRDGTPSPMLHAISGHLTEEMLRHYSEPSPEQVAAFMAQVGSLMDG